MFTEWWFQIFVLKSSPRTLGEDFHPFWRSYVSNGLANNHHLGISVYYVCFSADDLMVSSCETSKDLAARCVNSSSSDLWRSGDLAAGMGCVGGFIYREKNKHGKKQSTPCWEIGPLFLKELWISLSNMFFMNTIIYQSYTPPPAQKLYMGGARKIWMKMYCTVPPIERMVDFSSLTFVIFVGL